MNIIKLQNQRQGVQVEPNEPFIHNLSWFDPTLNAYLLTLRAWEGHEDIEPSWPTVLDLISNNKLIAHFPGYSDYESMRHGHL